MFKTSLLRVMCASLFQTISLLESRLVTNKEKGVCLKMDMSSHFMSLAAPPGPCLSCCNVQEQLLLRPALESALECSAGSRRGVSTDGWCYHAEGFTYPLGSVFQSKKKLNFIKCFAITYPNHLHGFGSLFYFCFLSFSRSPNVYSSFTLMRL